jgi:HTH-type transcriptional regulator/antitoxin PezA
MTNEEKEICIRIKELRKKTGLNQTDFGKRIEVAQGYLTNIETAKRPATEKIMKIICLQSWDGKTVNENWLRFGKGDMFEQLSEQQKIMKYTAMLLKDTDSMVANAIKNFIITYEQLDDASKKVLEEISIKYMENMKRGQP